MIITSLKIPRNKFVVTTSLLAVFVVFSGCATRSGSDAEVPAPMPRNVAEEITSTPLQRIDPDVIYYVGAAEILGQQKQFEQSAEFYLRAAEISQDPEIAARAVRVAAYVEDDDLILRGVDRWIELDPAAVEPHRYAAIIALKASDPRAAIDHISVVLESSDPEQWDRVAKALAGAPDKRAALVVFDHIMAEKPVPPVPALYQQYSDLAVQFGRLGVAENFASAIIDLDPTQADAFNWRGRLRHSMNRPEEAREDFAKAVELAPDDQGLRQTYAALLAELEEYGQAIDELDRIDPSMTVLYSQSLYAFADDNHELAMEKYEALGELDVEDPSTRDFLLGQLAETMELGADAALEHYRGVTDGQHLNDAKLRSAVILANDDRLAQARVILSRLQNGDAATAGQAFLAESALLREANQPKEALQVYDRALDLLPDNADLRFARALFAESLDMIELTESDLRHILKLRPNDANALNALGYTLADRTDRYEEALELIEAAYAQAPDEPAIVDSMGWVMFRLGRLEEALEFLERARDLDEDPEIMAHLGEVLWELGREEEARAVWSKALEANPESDAVTSTQARLTSR